VWEIIAYDGNDATRQGHSTSDAKCEQHQEKHDGKELFPCQIIQIE
jgi:hypothetical protein